MKGQIMWTCRLYRPELDVLLFFFFFYILAFCSIVSLEQIKKSFCLFYR